MTINRINNESQYSCRKKPTTPEEIKKIDERIADPYTLSGKDKLRAFHQWMGLDFDEDIFEKIIKDYSLDL